MDPFITVLIIFGISAATLTTITGGISAFIYYSIFRQGLSVVDRAIDRYSINQFIENFEWEDWEYDSETRTYTVKCNSRRGKYTISIPTFRAGESGFDKPEAFVIGQAIWHQVRMYVDTGKSIQDIAPINVEFVAG